MPDNEELERKIRERFSLEVFLLGNSYCYRIENFYNIELTESGFRAIRSAFEAGEYEMERIIQAEIQKARKG